MKILKAKKKKLHTNLILGDEFRVMLDNDGLGRDYDGDLVDSIEGFEDLFYQGHFRWAANAQHIEITLLNDHRPRRVLAAPHLDFQFFDQLKRKNRGSKKRGKLGGADNVKVHVAVRCTLNWLEAFQKCSKLVSILSRG